MREINKNHKAAKYIIALCLYIILAFIIYKDIFAKIYIDPTGDSYYSFYSWNTFFRACIGKGIFPFWNPLVLCGHPYHLESVSNFSLANILLLFFNVNSAWNIKLFLSTVLSGWLIFILLKKQFKISSIAAFIAGLTYMFLMPDLFDNPPFFLPLIFIVANKWLEQKKFSWFFLLSITLSVYFFNANPQFVLYLYVFIYFYIVMVFYSAKEGLSKAKLFRAASMGFLPFIMVGGLSSLRIIPMLEILHLSHRSSMSTFSFMLLPTHLINIIYPKFYMSSINPQLNFLPDEILNGIVSAVFGAERIEFINGPYVGILPFMLALLIMIKNNKAFAEKFFSYAALTILFYTMLNSLFYPIIVHIPLLNKMPFISRSYLIYNFSMAILAGFGMESLLKKEVLKLKSILVFASMVIISILFLRIIIQIILALFDKNILAFLTKSALPYITKQSFCKASSQFYYGRLQELIIFAKSWASPENIYFIIPTILSLISLMILYFYIKNKAWKNIFICTCILVIFADSYHNFHVQSYSKEEVLVSYRAADFLKKQQGIFRVMPLLQNYDEKNPSPMDVKTFLRPESNMSYGIMTPEGYRSLYLDRYADIVGLLVGQPAKSLKVKLCEFNNLDENILDFLNVKYIVASPITSTKFSEGYKLVYEDKLHKVFLNEDALERAFVVHDFITMKQKEKILKAVVSNLYFSRTVILEENISDFGHPKANTAILPAKTFIEKYEPNEVIINIDNSKEGFLILLDCYYPGWKAYVDGQPTKIFKANYIFRAVRVAQGKHTVKFLYDPVSLKIGFVLSFSFFILGIVLCIFLRNKNKA